MKPSEAEKKSNGAKPGEDGEAGGETEGENKEKEGKSVEGGDKEEPKEKKKETEKPSSGDDKDDKSGAHLEILKYLSEMATHCGEVPAEPHILNLYNSLLVRVFQF